MEKNIFPNRTIFVPSGKRFFQMIQLIGTMKLKSQSNLLRLRKGRKYVVKKIDTGLLGPNIVHSTHQIFSV